MQPGDYFWVNQSETMNTFKWEKDTEICKYRRMNPQNRKEMKAKYAGTYYEIKMTDK